MKKNNYERIFHQTGRFKKMFLVMRLSLFFLLVSTFAVFGRSYSQGTKLSLNLDRVTIKQVFNAIEQNSEYIIVYSDDILDVSEEVSVQVKNSPVEKILDQLFSGTSVDYQIKDRQIVITQRSKNEFAGTLQQPKNMVKGKVLDSKGLPLPGVTVVVKGTSVGTITDFNGEFTLAIPEQGEVLQFSFIGFQSQEIPVGTQKNFNVQLEEEVTQLDEIVAIGYGVQRKSDLTGATSRLTEENMNKAVSTSPVEMMQGRISGVNITQNNGEPGAGMSVRVRGTNSIRAGQDPLYVVDGVPLDNADITPDGGSASGITGSANKNPISFLNSDDIESIDILKDASSTAIYGARGANGVVLITTKKGKQGEGTLTYDGYVGVSTIREKLDMLSADEFRSYRKADGTGLKDLGGSVNWQDEIYRTALTHSHNLSFGGGTEKHTYRASMGYIDQEGIVETTGMERFNGKMMVTQKAINNRLNLTGSLIASHVKDSRAPIGETGGYEGDVILTALKLNPTYPVYNEDGSYFQYSANERNPMAMLKLTDDKTRTDHIIANISAEFEIVKNLKYKVNVGLDHTVAEREVNQNNELIYLSNKGEADVNSIRATNKLIENYITWLKNIGQDHRLNFLLGHAYQDFKLSTKKMNVNGFEVEDILYTDNLEYGNFSNANVSSSATESELQSFFGRVNYTFKDRYLFTLTGRYDGSSRFGENNKYGFFPSGAFAWRASEEEFLKGSNVISNLKFRLGWGKTGNQEIPNKISLRSVGTDPNANGYFNGTLTPGITYQRTLNEDIQWETTRQIDFGIDYGFLDDRLSGTVDLFHKKTKDVLLEIPSNMPAPTSTQWLNVPGLEIINKGIELNLTGIMMQKDDFYWDAGVNFSYVKNNVKNLPVTLIETGNASGQGLTDTRVQVIANDEPVGTFYGRVFQGFDSNGNSIYKTDSDGKEVMEYLGSALPDYTFSLTSKLEFKKFDFSMLWYGQSGNKVYNNTANALFTKTALNSGQNVTKKVMNSDESGSNANAFSSRFVEDGAFLRLSNVTLGYTLNTETVSWLSKARIYVTGNNLLLITGYNGYDPEVNTDASENGVPSMGIDFTSYPRARTFTFGVNLQF